MSGPRQSSHPEAGAEPRTEQPRTDEPKAEQPKAEQESMLRGWVCGTLRSNAAGMPVEHALGARSGNTQPHPDVPIVIKLGGSLLMRPNWPALLMPLVDSYRPRACCLVVGGGAVVDGLRMLDRVAPQPARLMHELAIDAMRLTGRLVSTAVRLPLIPFPPGPGEVAVLDVPAWLASGARVSALPVGWGVTSDTIAAHGAVEHGGMLLLAKSIPPPPCPGDVDRVKALALAGWVDESFPVASGPLVIIEWAAPQS